MVFNFNQQNPQYDHYHPHIAVIYSSLVSPHRLPGSVHLSMFVKYLELMGTE